MPTFELDNSNNGAAAIDINTTELFTEDARSELVTSSQLARSLFSVGFITLVMDVATALYRPPRGVVFQGHRMAYYLTLAGIFAAGLAEVSTAFWLSCSGQEHGRRRAFARAVLYASVAPVVVIFALGGSTVVTNV
uniref:Uncharacterized protein n=1 Tax=Setaria viridis TaxID=4556 RepID=A0A4U6UBS3_SETVI|nr:hypothetical protein SEVIR_5G099400v2 [Setaria viridis]